MDNRVIQAKMRLAAVLNSQGWQDVVRLAEESLSSMEREAIDEDDDTKANGLRRDAKGARKFWKDFMSRVTRASQVSDEPDDDEFLEVIM